jgi:hypothetical protein
VQKLGVLIAPGIAIAHLREPSDQPLGNALGLAFSLNGFVDGRDQGWVKHFCPS